MAGRSGHQLLRRLGDRFPPAVFVGQRDRVSVFCSTRQHVAVRKRAKLMVPKRNEESSQVHKVGLGSWACQDANSCGLFPVASVSTRPAGNAADPSREGEALRAQ